MLMIVMRFSYLVYQSFPISKIEVVSLVQQSPCHAQEASKVLETRTILKSTAKYIDKSCMSGKVQTTLDRQREGLHLAMETQAPVPKSDPQIKLTD